MRVLIDAENSDLFDVLEYVSFAFNPSQENCVLPSTIEYIQALTAEQKQFLDFVLSKYIETGVEELDQEKLAPLLMLKYKAIEDAKEIWGR